MSYQWMKQDRRFIAKSADELDDYLSSGVLLWRMTGVDIPLCPGNLLLSSHRLRALPEPDLQTKIESIAELIRLKNTAWKKKVNKEMPMRVRQWQELVEDFIREGKIDPSYIYNIRIRVMLELLTRETRYPDPLQQLNIDKTDEMLLEMTKPGEFVWDLELLELFPISVYPFLYRQTGR